MVEPKGIGLGDDEYSVNFTRKLKEDHYYITIYMYMYIYIYSPNCLE